MRIAGYARCSTKSQDVEGQARAITDWAARGAHELVEVYVDDAVSGRRADREGITRLLAEVVPRKIELVAITELSRIGRTVKFISDTVETLTTAGVKLVLVNSGTTIDYGTLEGRALLHALAMCADLEWCLIKERSARGRQTIKAKAIKVGPKPLDLSRAVLLALKEKKLSVRQIAAELKVSPATVARRLKELRTADVVDGPEGAA